VNKDAPNTSWRSTLRLLGAWTLLDLLCNVRFPGLEPALWYLLPSLDATALLALVALFAARDRRTPRALVLLGAAFVTAVRLFRFADGGSRRYFNRPINLGLDRFVAGDALVIVIGDHQPVAEVTRFSGSSAVPIHVWSRNPALIAPFRARGYTPGLRPSREASPRGMETLLPDLLSDFSTPTAGAH
jgi:hypothetical protein